MEKKGTARLDCIGDPLGWKLSSPFQFDGGLELSNQILGAIGAVVECKADLSLAIQVIFRGQLSVSNNFLKRLVNAVVNLRDAKSSECSPVFVPDVEKLGITAFVSIVKLAGSNQGNDRSLGETVSEGLSDTREGESIGGRAEVLLAVIERLSRDDFALAEELLAELDGMAMTKAFTNGLSDLLRRKGWRVICESCGVPSTLSWRKAQKANHSGRGQFSHTGPDGKTTRHKSISVYRRLKLAKIG